MVELDTCEHFVMKKWVITSTLIRYMGMIVINVCVIQCICVSFASLFREGVISSLAEMAQF